MSDIQFSGLSSGIDWGSIVDATINSKRIVENDWYVEQEQLDLKVTLYQELDNDLSSLQSTLDPLKLESTFLNKTADITTLSGSENAFTFTATADAEVQKYNVEVLSVASAHSTAGSRVDSTAEDLGHSGAFTLSAGGVDITVEVEETDSLDDIAGAINEAAAKWAEDNDSGVSLSAGILDNTLVLTSGTTGTAAAMTFTDDDGVLESLGVVEEVDGSKVFADELQAAADARIKLDGLEVTRPGNTIDDLLEGVTIDVNGIGEAKVDVTLDAEKAVTSIKSMVEAYNATLDWINIRVNEETVDDAESDTEKKWGLLHGDTLLWSCKQDMRTIAGSSYDVEGTFKTLSSIGLATESDNYGKSGKLEFDESKFMEAMLEDPQGVSELVNTFATDLQDFTDGMVSDSTVSVGGATAKEGKITNRIDYLETQSEEIDERIASWEAQLKMEQATLEARYTAMETSLAELQQNTGFLSALSSMNYSSGE